MSQNSHLELERVSHGHCPQAAQCILEKETEVIVQSAQSRTNNDSVLFAECKMMVGYHAVAVSSIVESLFVLELGVTGLLLLYCILSGHLVSLILPIKATHIKEITWKFGKLYFINIHF
jgi:hypothetical protein